MVNVWNEPRAGSENMKGGGEGEVVMGRLEGNDACMGEACSPCLGYG